MEEHSLIAGGNAKHTADLPSVAIFDVPKGDYCALVRGQFFECSLEAADCFFANERRLGPFGFPAFQTIR